MELDLETVKLFLKKCPNLAGIGDLKTWANIGKYHDLKKMK